MSQDIDKSIRAAVIFGMAVVVVSINGAVFPPGPWYQQLTQPPGTPPNIAFPLVWTLLYIAMAVAAWRVWRVRGFGRELRWWTLQLVVNALWMPVAFGAQALGWSLLVIVMLWVALAITLTLFWRTDRVAGLLLVPYLVWVSYAAYLNVGLLWLN